MLQNQVKVLELVAGFHKRTKCLAFAHADDQLAGFAQAGGKAGKVRIGRNDAKAIHIARIQQIHGVNDHGAVGCIFAGGVAILLDGNDGVVQQHILPAFQAGIRPIAVNTFAGRHAKGRSFIQNHLYIFGADVIRIDQNCQFQILHRSLTSLPV